MLLTIESLRISQTPKYPLKLYQKCARASLNIKDSRPWKGSLLQPGIKWCIWFLPPLLKDQKQPNFYVFKFLSKLQNNNKFYLLLNILMKIALPFADPVLSLLQTHKVAGISLLFSLLCHEAHMEAAHKNPSQESKLFHIIFGNTLKPFSAGCLAYHKFPLWASD